MNREKDTLLWVGIVLLIAVGTVIRQEEKNGEINKLAEYEDTNLTPQQIIEINKAYSEMARELAEYKKLDEQGLLLKLSCKVGDTVYTLNTLKNGKIVLGQVEEIDAFFIALCMMENRFGKTVFLTKEEAKSNKRNGE